DPQLGKMGTTMTLAGTLGIGLVIGHIGDSRAYLFRGGHLHQLTRDHTVAQALLDIGQISAEEAARHPRRHALTRFLSADGTIFDGDFQYVRLVDGDQLLLCTDGLTNMVDDATVAAMLAVMPCAAEACQALIDAALRNGGSDNVTVALARFRIGP